jgi:hypothetical protein
MIGKYVKKASFTNEKRHLRRGKDVVSLFSFASSNFWEGISHERERPST